MRARILLLVAVSLAGCTRPVYRNWADRETYPIIAEHQVFPANDIGRTQLEPPPESRLSDLNNPDFPPKPPDDPAAALYMASPGGLVQAGFPDCLRLFPDGLCGPRPGGMKGGKKWEKYGVTDSIEPPGWAQALGLDAAGTLKLDQTKAVTVALLDSREYQTALEAVYLAALALTLNRFEFDVQWFGRTAPTFTHFGSGGLPNGETNTVSVPSNLGFTRNLAAGGQLLVDFANSLVYQFTGPDQRQLGSNLIVTLIQPLLRGACREVRLETLTQAERDVLYAVRAFARFRKQFWADVAIGTSGGGFLDLLLAVQTLRNNQANLQRQEETYRLYDELFRGGRASVVELDQFYQSFLGARQDVVNAQVALDSAKDSFKLRLGLPPTLPVELDDSLLQQFELTDAASVKLRDDLEAFQRERLKELDEPPTVAALRGHFDALRKFADRIPEAVSQAASALRRWGRQLDRPAGPEDDPEQRGRARGAFDRLRKDFPAAGDDVTKLVAAIDKHRAGVTEATRKDAWEELTNDIKAALALTDAALAVQTEARIYLIDLPRVEVKECDAVAYAKGNRLDLQNRLGLVTDAWRKVWVAANALQGELDVVATANLGTDRDGLNPFNFAAENSSYSVGLRIDGPLNRLAERNAYRASLITYQRAKRAYVELADQIEFQIREDLRQLSRLRVGFGTARQQLLSAARQYESARLTLLGPRDRRSANDTTTLNLLQALSALLSARNALATNYINFEQRRVQLLLDLEALQLDHRGFPTNDPVPPADPPAARDPGEPPDPRPVTPAKPPRS